MSGTVAPRIDVVVPVYGGWTFVERCVASLQAQTVPVNVIVVDDRSPDDTLDRLRTTFPDVTLIANTVNRGFSASCNTGVRAGTAEIVVLLNSDVETVPTFAANLLAAFDEAGSQVGTVAPALLSPDGTVDSFGITIDVTGAGYVRYHGADVHTINATTPAVLGPYGALAAYRREALNDAGLLDENIFMYGEELELAVRLRACGWEAAAVPFIGGTHIGGASAGKASPRQLYLAGFGRGYFLRVYRILSQRHGPRAALSEFLVTIVWTFDRRDLVAWRGRRDGWRAGKPVARRALPPEAADRTIGFLRGMQMRRAGYWSRLK
ncbi:MAG: hypothetical protein DI566_07805 [Microbacterium sp.]|nr:MAG: hypothetical protein DI566_07805 [Microbacterium sp.]